MISDAPDFPPIDELELDPEDLELELKWRELHRTAHELSQELPGSYPEEADPGSMTVPFVFSEADLERLMVIHQGRRPSQGELPSGAPEEERDRMRGKLSRRLRRAIGVGKAGRDVGYGMIEWRGDEAAELELGLQDMQQLLSRLRAPGPEPALSKLI